MTTRRHFVHALGSAAALGSLPFTARAQGLEQVKIINGFPAGGTADCVLKTSAEIFTKIVRDAYTPGPSEFLSGAIKSNDVGLLMTFQKVFALA